MVCPYCGKEYFGSGGCPRCGPGARTFCPRCGSPADGPFCSRCGAKVSPSTADSSDKNKWAAFFLCLFLGGLGIHRFYTGKVGTGILWLLLFLLPFKLWTVAVLVDLITIVMGKFRDKQGRYLR
ncbi:MAG: NINE protein [Oscillospiraceae bacterium]|nr:NINE protein [Oscillospiraceae bacterium]